MKLKDLLHDPGPLVAIITALATVVIALYTFFLSRFTKKQAELTRASIDQAPASRMFRVVNTRIGRFV